MKKVCIISCIVVLVAVLGIVQVLAAPCGDTNSDGNINITDALLIAQASVGGSPANFDRSAADVSGDGNVNIQDALLVAQYSVGIIASLPCQATQPTTNPGGESTYEAENATLSEAELETEHSGYIGSGYVNLENNTTSYLEFNVYPTTSGSIPVVFRYANGSGSERLMEISVNGSVVNSSLSFPDTGEWTSWKTVLINVNLNSGQNKIRARSVSSEGGPNIDNITIGATSNTPISTPTPTPIPSTPIPTYVDPGNVDTKSMIGFATLNGGTTGGSGGTSVNVSSSAALQDAIKNKGSSPLTINVSGTITPGDLSKIEVKEVDDITIIGSGSGAEFNGIGIKIWKANNIIIRNLRIHHVDIGDKDCISIEGPASNIWVDHCELYNDLDHDKDYYDGLLDAKAESQYITVSWCYMHDSYKTSLVGSSDSDNYDRKITYHHNKIEDCNSRLPSYRFGTGHIYNNYYINNLESGINCRQGAVLRIEGNYFSNILDPIVYLYSDTTGYWDVRDNIFDNCSGSQPTTSTGSFSPPYNYDLDPVSSVPSIVNANAGVGKI